MAVFENFKAELPTIHIVRHDQEEYAALRRIFSLSVTTQPLAIAVPKTADEVASIVRFANKTDVPISVRCGGHDLFGRSLVEGGIVIDIRALDHVTVDKENGRATIGGGVCSAQIGKVLSEHDCITPCPNISTVGYIGFATTGGYGQTAHKFGLGVDHLLAAKIVDADGNIVQADDDVMKGIRGAGGNFGIVVEATIKIYPFAQILAGPIIFESSDHRVSMKNVQDGMEALAAAGDLPPELDLQPMYAFGPTGPYYGGLFMWSGPDLERGRQYLDKVSSFHPVVMTQVMPQNMSQALALWAPLVPEVSYVNSRAINVSRITPQLYEIIVSAFETMPPDPAVMLTWHEVRQCSPSFDSKTSLPSVFNARKSHYVIEVLANAVDPANFDAVTKWGLELRDELVRAAPNEILDASWLASTPTSELGSLEKLYGEENARFLRKLKAEKDLRGVFKHALPNLSI